MDWLGQETEKSLSRFIIHVLYPGFIIYNVLNAETLVKLDETCTGALFGFFSIVIGFLVARIVCKICRIKNREVPAFCFCAGIFNYGFFAIPVAALFFGNELVVKIILFNLGVEVAIWTVGVLMLTSAKLEFRKILNPPSISVMLALGLQWMGGKELFPQFAWEALSMIGNCSIPMALMIIGASFYDLLKVYSPSPFYRIELGTIITRVLIVPSIFLLYAVYGWIPPYYTCLSEVLIVQAAMPAGVFALVVVKNYKQDSQTALRTIMITMVLGIISIPTWLWVGGWLMELQTP
jgi:predicted permease